MTVDSNTRLKLSLAPGGGAAISISTKRVKFTGSQDTERFNSPFLVAGAIAMAAIFFLHCLSSFVKSTIHERGYTATLD